MMDTPASLTTTWGFSSQVSRPPKERINEKLLATHRCQSKRLLTSLQAEG